jgi:hypothetical protein
MGPLNHVEVSLFASLGEGPGVPVTGGSEEPGEGLDVSLGCGSHPGGRRESTPRGEGPSEEGEGGGGGGEMGGHVEVPRAVLSETPF